LSPTSRHSTRCAAGFSLVEILVGLGIGMIGIIVMMQVFSVYEGNKRTTTGGGDAQNSGALALNTLLRDIRQSGYGISSLELFGCDVVLRAGVTLKAMAPVTINPTSGGTAIIPAGDPNTDNLLVVYGSAAGSPQGDGIVSQPSQSAYKPITPTSFTVGDFVIATPSSRAVTCSLRTEPVQSIAPAPPAAPLQVNVATGAAGSVGGLLHNLGKTPRILAYAVRNGSLTVCDYIANDCGDVTKKDDTSFWVPIFDNIVSLRAQYGRDTVTTAASANTTYIVNKYDQATPTTACGWAQTASVRIAVVARSGHYDKEFTGTVPTWAASTAGNPTGSDSAPIDLTKNPNGTANADWQHYRYKLFQTVVPLRNVGWMGVQKLC
jgi:type IV pilus assembly protein PilW